MVPPGSFDDYYKWLGKQVEVINHALEGIPGRESALPRVLGQLARPARDRRAVEEEIVNEDPQGEGGGPI